jgi:predicted enzyme related to lactoylglutathione lyase
MMKRVTGIGGIFFKAEKPKELSAWYARHLGLDANEHGATFKFRDEDALDRKTMAQWSPFSADTTYFGPSQKPFMINYRVYDLEKLLEVLKQEGVTIVDEIATYDYGKFVHIMDPEGNKIELWEPFGEPFTNE